MADHTIDWEQLVQTLKKGEAVLVLGPGVEEITMPDGTTCLLQTLLAQQLSEKIKQRMPDLQLTYTHHLGYVSQHFEDAYGKQSASLLGDAVSEFYEQYSEQILPIYRQIANAHFRYIINTNPNKLLLSAFEAEGYWLADRNFAYYNYKNPAHNQNTVIDTANISEATPLIYNLFGVASDPLSLILTDARQIELVETILQTDKDTIPPNIAIQFMSRRDNPINKRLVFVGFDFNDWRLRIILHLINRYQYQGSLKSYAPQDLNNLDKLTQFFYQRNFNLDFIPHKTDQFLSELAKQYEQFKAPESTQPQLDLFIMYHENDEDICQELETHLSLLKRNQLIAVWHRGKLTAGYEIDQTIDQQLRRAQVVLLLVSADFLASDTLYKNQLDIALQREKNKQAFVIPIIARACAWESAAFKDLKTILPSPSGRKPLLGANNVLADTDFSQLAKELEIIFKKLIERLK
jgi:hypothetical protein